MSVYGKHIPGPSSVNSKIPDRFTSNGETGKNLHVDFVRTLVPFDLERPNLI